jgi:hypothetical protein
MFTARYRLNPVATILVNLSAGFSPWRSGSDLRAIPVRFVGGRSGPETGLSAGTSVPPVSVVPSML